MQSVLVMSTTDTMALPTDASPTWYPTASSGEATTPTQAAPRSRRDPRVIAAISDLIHSYHRPAYMTDERGEVICMNAAAGRLLDERGEDAPMIETSAEVTIAGQSYRLFVPAPEEHENTADLGDTNLPPRLARIARLVVSGCTDKQIATRTGLSFSTVRTYVRQIYRRVGVHNRVELVHRTNAGSVLLP